MMRLLNSILFDRVSFVTLTYRYNQLDAKRGYRDLRVWHKSLVRLVGPFGAIWRAEKQERGAVHYHIFVVDAPVELNRNAMVDAWMRVTKQEGDAASRIYGVDVVDFGLLEKKDIGVMVAYLAKYTAKDKSPIVGKQWGVLGRSCLRETGQTYTADKEACAELVGEILQRGGVSTPIDGGGVVYRLYFGHVGSTDNLRVITDFSGSPCVQDDKQVEYSQSTFII